MYNLHLERPLKPSDTHSHTRAHTHIHTHTHTHNTHTGTTSIHYQTMADILFTFIYVSFSWSVSYPRAEHCQKARKKFYYSYDTALDYTFWQLFLLAYWRWQTPSVISNFSHANSVRRVRSISICNTLANFCKSLLRFSLWWFTLALFCHKIVGLCFYSY